MKILALEFASKGFDHKQIERTGDVALFERRRVGKGYPHWEVVKIGRHNGYEIGGVKVEAAETYPSSESWGTKGWTFQDFTKAQEKFRMLTRERVRKFRSKNKPVENSENTGVVNIGSEGDVTELSANLLTSDSNHNI